MTNPFRSKLPLLIGLGLLISTIPLVAAEPAGLESVPQLIRSAILGPDDRGGAMALLFATEMAMSP